jgi:hypothetical protein
MSPTLTILSLVVLVAGYFARRFVWWYLGIDRAIAALENIDASLRTLPSVREFDARAQRPPVRAA